MQVELPPTELGALPTLDVGGYGYGLSTMDHGGWQSVGHGGGLPGFGSHMRWAPDYDLGIVALANVTYARVHAACSVALRQLIETDELPRRVTMPSRALDTARDGIVQLLAEWDDALADRLFADNFFLDQERTRWQQRLEQLRETHGRLQPDGEIEPENWLRGRWRMQGERGWCSVWLSLAPILPPRIQALAIESVLPPGPVLSAVVARVMTLDGAPDAG